MLTFILIIVAVILATFVLVWLIDKYIPSKFKSVLNITLWVLIGYLGYQTYNSIYEPIKFNKVKVERYLEVIENLKDIRDAQLAHRQITGKFTDKFDKLVVFIDTAQYTITQRRDSSVIDLALTELYGGVETFKDTILIDTLGLVSVKDSLFKTSTRYKTMMNVPVGEPGSKFKLQAGVIQQSNVQIPVFEASVAKRVLLYDQNNDLIIQENQVIAVDGVNGDKLKVGSMDEVNTSGNWPKTYGSNE